MSIEAVPLAIDQAAQAAVQQPTARQPVSVVDIAHFHASYAQAQPSGDAVQGVPAAASDSEGFRALLGTLDSLNGRVDQLGDLTRVASSKSDLTPGDMLMLSVRCHEFLFHCELTSNVANRTSDGVQQLFRQQS